MLQFTQAEKYDTMNCVEVVTSVDRLAAVFTGLDMGLVLVMMPI